MKNIKNIFTNAKSAINKKSMELYCKVKNLVTNENGEFYVDKTVAIIICVVVGVLLMGIVYGFINTNIKTQLDTKIAGLWAYTPSAT